MPDAGDTALKFGPARPPLSRTQIGVQPIPPGASITYYFDMNNGVDYRLVAPPNESGAGLYLVADLQYDDPLVQYEPIEFPSYGRIQGIQVSKTTLTTNENGQSGTFTVNLDHPPTANVTIALTGNTAEGTITPASLTFTPLNWAQPQTVTVKGVPDSTSTSVDRSNTTYTVTLGAAVSTDPRYSGLQGPSVSVTNDDRDGNITVTTDGTASGNQPYAITTDSTGATPTFKTITLTLVKQPTVPVTVMVVNGNPSEGLLAPVNGSGSTQPDGSVKVTFATTDTPGTIKKVEVHGVKNTAAPTTTTSTSNVTVTYNVTFSVSATGDQNFDGINLPSVSVSNIDPPPTTTP